MLSESAVKRYLFGGIAALLLKSSLRFSLGKANRFALHKTLNNRHGHENYAFYGVAAERYGFGKKCGSPRDKERACGGEEER